MDSLQKIGISMLLCLVGLVVFMVGEAYFIKWSLVSNSPNDEWGGVAGIIIGFIMYTIFIVLLEKVTCV